jgi:hypothetical protein
MFASFVPFFAPVTGNIFEIAAIAGVSVGAVYFVYFLVTKAK